MARHTRPDDEPRDRGSALLVVLVTMTIMIALVGVGLNHAIQGVKFTDRLDGVVETHAIQGVKFTDRQSDWNSALVAAEAGIDDYLARLNKEDNYWQTADCGNVALRGDPAKTKTKSSCGWTASTPLGWKKVVSRNSSTGKAPVGEFHYDVDVSETPIDGTITVRSTGRVNGVTRTVQTVLRRGGFGEFLYYTVYETTDPANEAVYSDLGRAARECPRYWWGDPARTSYCSTINFVTGDRINGPMHTNDAIKIQGNPRFNGTTTTSYPNCRGATSVGACLRPDSTGSPVFTKGVSYRAEIELPTSIGDMRQYVTKGSVPDDRLGCLYTGPTRIMAKASGKLQVWSPWSGRANGPALNNTAVCGTASALQGASGAEINLPHNKVILVQNVPSKQTTPTAGPCATGAIGGPTGDKLPVVDDYNNTLSENDCRNGNLYLEGTVKGRITMVADNNIVITKDVLYQGGENGIDALGLIAENSVKIHHPVKRACVRSSWYGCVEYGYVNITDGQHPVLSNVTLHAAVLTLQHSFGVQSYNYGAMLGNLRVYGSLAQRFRGPVGTTGSGGTGYLKDYNYDSRLRYAPPPYFLDPVRSGWGQKVYGEVAPRYGS